MGGEMGGKEGKVLPLYVLGLGKSQLKAEVEI